MFIAIQMTMDCGVYRDYIQYDTINALFILFDAKLIFLNQNKC